MSWGSLGGSQTKRKVSDPLPDFLVEDRANLGSSRQEPAAESDRSNPFVEADSKSQRKFSPLPEEPRKSYGVRAPRSMVIETSHKTIFASFVFFTLAVLMAFGVGFFFGKSYTSELPAHQSKPSVTRPVMPEKANKDYHRSAKKVSETEGRQAALSAINEEELKKEESTDDAVEELEDDEEFLD